MAKSLETFRSSIIDSIKGRKAGLDIAGYLVGVPGVPHTVEDLSTAASTVTISGISRVTVTGSSQGPVQYTIPAPREGVTKILSLNTTSTASFQFLSTAAGASILAASDGTTKSLVNLIGQGGAVTLVGLSSAIWQVIASVSTGGVTYTTST